MFFGVKRNYPQQIQRDLVEELILKEKGGNIGDWFSYYMSK